MSELQTNEPEDKEVEDEEQATSEEIESKVIFYDRTYRLHL